MTAQPLLFGTSKHRILCQDSKLESELGGTRRYFLADEDRGAGNARLPIVERPTLGFLEVSPPVVNPIFT